MEITDLTMVQVGYQFSRTLSILIKKGSKCFPFLLNEL